MFPQNTLWSRIVNQSQTALQSGALQPIPTKAEFIEDGGIRFIVRIAHNLQKKDEAKLKQRMRGGSDKTFNPFLPYDPDMYVADLSKSHICLLNKFNVIPHHLLIVTKEFEEQDNLLTLQDFEALWLCLQEFDGLGFYNGGQAAGASQRHKHLQIVPLPFTATETRIPVESVLLQEQRNDTIQQAANLPFAQALILLANTRKKPVLHLAEQSLQSYYNLRAFLKSRPTDPYNLLIAKNWMLCIPRTRESYLSIQVNALGFAGSFFVRNKNELDILKHHGPINILKEVTLPKN